MINFLKFHFKGLIPGPPFLCGALLVFCATLLNWSLPARRKLLFRRGGGAGMRPRVASASGSGADAAALLIDDGGAGEKAAVE